MAKLTLLVLLTLSLFGAVLGTDDHKTVIVGGHSGGYISKADIICNGQVKPLPDLPYGIGHNTVFVHDDKVYTCGGEKGADEFVKECLTLDLPPTPSSSWKSELSLPVETSFQPMIVAGHNLWILIGTKVIVVPFNGDPTSEYDLPSGLDVGEYSCGQGSDDFMYVIPAGSSTVWMNNDPTDPTDWMDLEADLGTTFSHAACMIDGVSVYVTGGSVTSSYYKTAVRYNVDEYEVYPIADLTYDRAYHAMGFVDGQIAAIGGYNSTRMDSIEVYDATEDSWTLHPLKLTAGEVNEMGYASFEM